LYAAVLYAIYVVMSFDLSVLSPSQFESLSADLIGRDTGFRFEQFGEGRDGGIDGRRATGTGHIILQAKQYDRSGISKLKSELRKEREKIDKLGPKRYILSTSVSMTPPRKAELMEILGPAVLSPGDIYGKEDLEGLLRNHADLVEAHPALWETSGKVLGEVLHRTLDERERRNEAPAVLQSLLPKKPNGPEQFDESPRDVVFILSSRPHDDEFVLWLGPKLEAHGYTVFADILTLEPGHRWRKEINRALEYRAARVLVVASETTGQNDQLLDTIDKAGEIAHALEAEKFIIPLRMKNGVRIDGLRDAVPVDFKRGWDSGLQKLLDTLRRQGVPYRSQDIVVAPQWDIIRKRGAVALVPEPEQLVSNWLAIVEMPDEIHFYEASGAIREDTLKRQISRLSYPAKQHGRGLISFADPQDIRDSFEHVANLQLSASMPIDKFAENGFPKVGMQRREASNLLTEFIRNAWERYCVSKGMISYDYSAAKGFHVSSEQAPNGHKIRWGKQGGGRRSSMLRNIARKHVWKYGVTAMPRLWPFWHLRLKARVLFAEDNGTAEGKPVNDAKKMHRLRRSGCKGWRNKQWHGRLLAFLELLSEGSAFIRVPLAPGRDMLLSSEPVLFTSPVSTSLPDIADADGEEEDESTLGRPEVEEESA
jgi:hypothetical protein